MRERIATFSRFLAKVRVRLARSSRDRGRPGQRPHLEELEPRLALSSLPTPDHVVLVIEENHGYSQIIGNGAAPYINDQLAQEGALFTNSYAIEHPSQPNYLDLFSGSNQGVTSDACPQTFDAPNLADGLEGTGYTFTGYSEDLPYAGFEGCMNMAYGRNHNPWVNFVDVSPDDNLPFDSFPSSDYSQLPTVAIVVPNKRDDMHDGMDPARIQAGDQWLRDNIDPYVKWASDNNSLLMVTFDEDNNMEGNHIATLFVGPMVQSGQYDEYVDHFVLLRTLEDLYGLPYAGASADVDPITDVWTGPGPRSARASAVPAGSTSAVNPLPPGTGLTGVVPLTPIFGEAARMLGVAQRTLAPAPTHFEELSDTHRTDDHGRNQTEAVGSEKGTDMMNSLSPAGDGREAAAGTSAALEQSWMEPVSAVTDILTSPTAFGMAVIRESAT